MSKKRRGSSRRGPRRSVAMRTIRRNPAEEMIFANPPRRSYARRAAAYVGKSGIGTTMKHAAQMLLGALVAKVAQKKIGSGTAETATSWELKDYAISAVSVYAVGLLAKAGFRSAALGDKIMEGGTMFLMLQLTKEITERSATARDWLGADPEPYTLGAYDEGASAYSVGDLYDDGAGNQYVLGADYRWHPASAAANVAVLAQPRPLAELAPGMQRPAAMLPAATAGLGDVMAPVGPLGDVMAPVGPLGNAEMQAPGEMWT